MCGITGFFSSPDSFSVGSLDAMTDSMSHRGPDDRGVCLEADSGIALGHRRLSVLDLSPLGHQPMKSACGRYLVAYNGEIYNHMALRGELEFAGYSFSGTSDTETLLTAVVHWGLRGAVERFVGMFAFALWDRNERKLFLVRDRLGIKPLYYGRAGKDFIFASELKALAAHPDFVREMNMDALALFFRHNYIPAPYAVFEGVHKLEPGSILSISSAEATPTIERYWSAEEIWGQGLNTPFGGSLEEAVDALDQLISDAVGCRLLSDVPLGAFLSGGIDSSMVVAAMQAVSSTPVKTFTIGFHESSHDEAEHARAVANHLGTDHTELYVDSRALLDTVPRIPTIWDEPFSDPSQIPTQLLSELTRRHVTVSLSGDGGDELFAGYTRYSEGVRHGRLHGIPYPVRALASAVAAKGLLGKKNRQRFKALASQRFSDMYRYMLSHHKNPESLVLNGSEPDTIFAGHAGENWGDRIQQMSWLDLETYLPDDILVKLDRASMSTSLEARVPLLDHRVAEFAARLPSSMKVHGTTGKVVLRKVLERYVPRELFDRPKKGFGMPISTWLRGDLLEWADALLSTDRMKRQGYLDASQVQSMWHEHRTGKRDWAYCLWDILMFQAWADEWMG